MFTESAQFYDAVYNFKDYQAEAEKVHALIQEHKVSDGNDLLDVACGTAKHDAYLKNWYTISGVDLDSGLLEIARQRLPDATFHVGDMREFSLNQQFDAVISLFSSVGYLPDADALDRTLVTMTKHTKPGGVVIIEPWIKPEHFGNGRVSVLNVEIEKTKIVRMTRSERIGKQGSILHFHYLIGREDEIEHFTERHDMRLHSHEEYMTAFEKAGLNTLFDAEGITGRGLYIGVRPLL